MDWIKTERVVLVASNYEVTNNISIGCRIVRIIQIYCRG